MKAKILTLDIEVSPLTAYSWGPKWETSLIEVINEGQVLSFSAKWLDGQHITKGQPDYKGYKKGSINDKEIIKELHSLLDQAEIVVVQNGKAFDLKYINARFLFHGLTPPSPYKVVDTKSVAKRYLRLPSYSLDSMCEYFGIGKKQEHEGFPLWTKCMSGDLQAWKRMLSYNKHDVTLTESLYLKLRPYITTHPNLNLYFDHTHLCPNCGSSNVQKRGFGYTRVKVYQRYQCVACGAWSKSASEERPLS